MAISFEKANRTAEEWGDKPCSHPNVEKEYGPLGHTGDYRCVQCGATFTEDEVKQIKSNKNDLYSNENN